ncbi:hypothetical protein [Marinimicrococcus flavescens]|uniref:Transposase n=1 Tax=Marinimicrococcus flavescens TaxID=3031815 RepID=A0AAP3XR80_9PROT|nr:hypothetical protein [Marinimicrococcus flavescens]
MRFRNLSVADPVPDANTLRDVREALIRVGALDRLLAHLDRAIKEAGWLPMSGQIVDASLVAATWQRHTEEEKAAIRAGRKASEVWADTAWRSKANEHVLADRGKISRIRRNQPAGEPMPRRTSRASAGKSAIRARVGHVFARQRDRIRLTIRSIGIECTEATVIMADIACNPGRRRCLEGRVASA